MSNYNNNQLLTKKDLWEILGEFFDKIIAPWFEKFDNRFEKIERKLEEHDERFDKLDDRLDRQGKQLENHEERIVKLESPLT